MSVPFINMHARNHFATKREIYKIIPIDGGNIRPLNFDFALEAAIQYFPYKLVFCKANKWTRPIKSRLKHWHL